MHSASAPPRIVWPLLFAAFYWAGAGCAGKPPPRAKVREAPPVAEAAGPGFVTPAHWDYHPPAPDAAIASIRVGGAGCVFTAEGGQRWASTPVTASDPASTDKPPSSSDCAGKAEVSAFIAPEDLRSVIRRSEKSWIFVGESGALYEAPDPLAAFSRTVAAPEPFAKVAGAGVTVLATTYEGKLLRWDEASGWQAAPAPPPGARIFDVAVGEGGRALALAFPEALFTSTNGGSTWAPAGAPLIGARMLGTISDGDLAAQGLLESLEWNPKSASFRRSPLALRGDGASLDLTVGRAPAAAAVSAGRAFFDGDRYVEVFRPDNEGEDWSLARGKIEGRLTTTPLPKTGECSSLWIGGRGKILFTACISLQSSDITADIRKSQDGGDTWSEPLSLATPDTDQIKIAVSPEGNALITGVCKPTSEGGGECRPVAPLLVRPDGAKMKAMISGAPQLSAIALLPAFSFDGHSAYFLGRRTKDDKLTLFVSHDGGETFSLRLLESPAVKAPRRPRDDDDESAESEPVDDTIEVDESSTLRPGEDGTLGLLVLRARGYTYMTTDEDGRVLGASTPPTDDAMMGGYGRRVVAFSSISSEGRYGDQQVVKFWESADGGSTWDEQSAPLSLTREFNRGNPGIACSLVGCLFGETMARVGWGGQADPAVTDRVVENPPTNTPSVLTPIVCELSPTTKWTRIEHVNGANAVAAPLPDVNQTMRGRSMWSVLTVDPATGAVGAVSATLPESGEGEAKVVTRQLLGSRAGGSAHTATHISTQMEGYAAVRLTFPVEKNGQIKPSTPMKNLEVVWENYMESTSSHARIADAGVLDRTDVSLGGGDYNLDLGLITVTVKGIVVRPHSLRSRMPMAFFLDAAGKSERLTLPAWPERALSGYVDVRGDAVAIDGQILGAGVVKDSRGDWVSLALAHRTPQPAPAKPAAPGSTPTDHWDITPFAIAPSRSGDSPLVVQGDWTYAGKTSIGVTSLVGDPRRSRGWAYFYGFRGDGTFAPPLPLATLLDLGDRPRPCSAADRAAAPRFESLLFSKGEPLFPGMRHPVLVSEPPAKNAVGVSDPIALLTSAAVSHGPPASPCVAGWEVRSNARNVGAILSGDLARSWLFRSVPAEATRPAAPGKRPEPGTTAALEYRPMTCRFDPKARIPDSIWGEPGTVRMTP